MDFTLNLGLSIIEYSTNPRCAIEDDAIVLEPAEAALAPAQISSATAKLSAFLFSKVLLGLSWLPDLRSAQLAQEATSLLRLRVFLRLPATECRHRT